MKFSLAATALFALSSTAAPAAIEGRAPTVVGTITGAVNTLAGTLPVYENTISMFC